MSRDGDVLDTFELPVEMQEGILAESVAIMQRAALERACVVAQRAAERLERGRLLSLRELPMREREYLHALEVVHRATQVFLGLHDQEANDNG